MNKMLVFDSFGKTDIDGFLQIYRESSKENSLRWYPDLSEKEALEKYENGYIEYMKNEFFVDERRLFVLADGNVYLSALRLSKLKEGKYYLEALETNPRFRKRGYAKELILRAEEYLKNENKEFTVISNVEKNNTASLNTHFAAGFEITADYYIENGERFDSDYELTYQFKADSGILGKRVKVTVDRPLGTYHPKHKNIFYPINYGYIDGIIAPDGEEQDAYILGVDKPVSKFEGIVVAIIKRLNDVEDKWVIAPDGSTFTKEEIENAVHFQEQFFDYEIIMV